MRPHRWQPTRLPRPWDSPGKNTGVGCHFLLQCIKVKSESEVAQLCPTLSEPMDCSPPGSSLSRDFPGESAGVGCHCLLQLYILVQGKSCRYHLLFNLILFLMLLNNFLGLNLNLWNHKLLYGQSHVGQIWHIWIHIWEYIVIASVMREGKYKDPGAKCKYSVMPCPRSSLQRLVLSQYSKGDRDSIP